MTRIERTLKTIAAIPLLGTALFLAADTAIILVLAVSGRTDLARLMVFKILHGQHGRRRELRIGLNMYRYVEYPRVIRWLGVRPGERVLDVGASYGLLPVWYVRKGCEVWAVDITDRSFREWRTVAGKRRLYCQQHDARRLGLKSESFDGVLCVSTIEHIEEDGAVAREIGRVLKPGGTAVFTFPVNSTKFEIRDNPDFGLVRMYDEAGLAERIIRPSGLTVVAMELWPISARYARAPLWEYSRFASVLRMLHAYPRRPQLDWPTESNTLGHHIGILVLSKTDVTGQIQ